VTIRAAIGRFSSVFDSVALRVRLETLALLARDFDWDRESGWAGSRGTPCGV
jgi:hypothetical protein